MRDASDILPRSRCWGGGGDALYFLPGSGFHWRTHQIYCLDLDVGEDASDILTGSDARRTHHISYMDLDAGEMDQISYLDLNAGGTHQIFYMDLDARRTHQNSYLDLDAGGNIRFSTLI